MAGGHSFVETCDHVFPSPILGDEARVGVGINQCEESGIIGDLELHTHLRCARMSNAGDRRHAARDKNGAPQAAPWLMVPRIPRCWTISKEVLDGPRPGLTDARLGIVEPGCL